MEAILFRGTYLKEINLLNARTKNPLSQTYWAWIWVSSANLLNAEQKENPGAPYNGGFEP